MKTLTLGILSLMIFTQASAQEHLSVMPPASIGTAAEAKEIVLATYFCTTPREIGTTLEDPRGERGGIIVQLQKRQLDGKIFFVYMQTIYPSFELVDQGIFKDIGIPWGRTREGIISSVEEKNIFLASADAYDIMKTNSLRVTWITLQNYSICKNSLAQD